VLWGRVTGVLREGLFFPNPYHSFFFGGKKPGVFYFAYHSENNLGYGFNQGAGSNNCYLVFFHDPFLSQ
jgi:hypothetical protein